MGTRTKDFFGSVGSGVLGFSSPISYYFNVTKIIKEDDFKAELQATYGLAKADQETGSLISKAPTAHGIGGRAKVSYKGFGVGYEVPLRIVKGEMEFTTPTSRTADGFVNYSTYTANLKPDAMERRGSVFYEDRRDLFSIMATYTHTSDKFNVSGLSEDEVKFGLFYYY